MVLLVVTSCVDESDKCQQAVTYDQERDLSLSLGRGSLESSEGEIYQ